jgi:hypothetical protein
LLHPITEIWMQLDKFVECISEVYGAQASPVDWPLGYCVHAIRRHARLRLAFSDVAQASKAVRRMEPIHIAIRFYVFGLDYGYGT